ncbi:hypothetical protein HYALB_00008765 [Hymenoscyphus albidus]|uniref:Uncharacterized protein n=1 Tax=Hymenoscyphus albidus TaxID=595503 RepID=A0A9N9LG82_9HELO|nr:hypothetical protein HYALB_00008765 [Hymenoscyphus albidus]
MASVVSKVVEYIIPISDNGGSSSELIRVFGGPGIGDVRSRLIRLIPTSPNSPSTIAMKTLFNHRLSSTPSEAREEWHQIVEGTHPLWQDIPSQKLELIRSFFNTINLEILKRTRKTSAFNFQTASVGNLFLTGARLFTGSFESAIYLFGAITNVPANIKVIPAINSNFSHHIAAGLQDGTQIVGQNEISHPSAPTAFPSSFPSPYDHDTPHEDAHLPGSLPSLRKQNIIFAKSHTSDLPTPIERIWYINPYGQELRPTPNPKVLQAIKEANGVVYSIGSLYTSILPCLILRGVGSAIREKPFKILILNGSLDRETRWEGGEYTAKEFVRAIARAGWSSEFPPAELGGVIGAEGGGEVGEMEYRCYVSHIIHLQGEGTPRVDKAEMARLGIETVRIYGRRREGEGGMVYDGTALEQALEAIMGRRDLRSDRSRRNTLGNALS